MSEKNSKKNSFTPNTQDNPIELTEATENYLKHIYWLIRDHGVARVSEVSKVLNRSMSSVSEAIRRLQSQGLVTFEKYGTIQLTELGESVAERITRTHRVFFELLRLIGVPQKTAYDDACSMEHFIHPETIEKISTFLAFLKTTEEGKKALKKFTETKS